MTDAQQRAAARKFAMDWMARGRERADSQPFWTALLRDVYGVRKPEEYIRFEEEVKLDSKTGFIDGWIFNTKVMIEQKSRSKNLDAEIRQSDGTMLTPFQQAKRYAIEKPYSERPRWIVTCNFTEFRVYDMERPNGKPETIRLTDLERDYYRLNFLVDPSVTNLQVELDLSVQAGEIVGQMYDALRKQYVHPDSPASQHSLNVLCVRLVFCLYAEDAGIFGRKSMFHDYLARYSVNDMRRALLDLFKVLDTKVEDRDPYLTPELAAFPYVNGGLFADPSVEIPLFTEEIRHRLLVDASENFNWSQISPTIFGAVFESTLNPETRRKGGMHYTSILNIHKVIDPLFLDSLNREMLDVVALERGDVYTGVRTHSWRRRRLKDFQSKLASLTFFDPACGSGNFLTETYLSLRRMENKILMELLNEVEGQISIDGMSDDADLGIKVSIGQFYGVEINDFAVSVARTALWIAENQMMQETSTIINRELEFLPLKTDAHILKGNALRMDWGKIIPPQKLNYIMGNPPFVGHQWRSPQQVEDMDIACAGFPKHGKLDYVCAWYCKAIDMMEGTNIHTALVSTNSICQGESVGILWKPLFDRQAKIEFAHRTFVWTSEAKDAAAVHCVIVGFTCGATRLDKSIYDHGECVKAAHINGYLLDAPDIFIKSRGKAMTPGIPAMRKGSQATDGGNLLLSEEEAASLGLKYPTAKQWIHRFMMGEDFINNTPRYCLWLVDANPGQLRKCPAIMERLSRVSELRSKSPTLSVQRDAATPWLFTQIRQPKTRYLAVPRVSSVRRKYVPMAFLEPDVIAGDKLQFIEGVTLYHFGCLTSSAHNVWLRTVAGRLKSDYSYSPAVYNNFPWPDPTPAQKARIEQTAQQILNVREKHPNDTLADLYDNTVMPADLRSAHEENDNAVLDAYGLPHDIKEPDCVAHLMGLYQKLTT